MAKKTKEEWDEAFSKADMRKRAPRKFTAINLPLNAYEAKLIMDGADIDERVTSDFVRHCAMETAIKIKKKKQDS